MTFYELLEAIITLLQQHGRVSYRALKRQFDVDDDYLADLKDELVEVQQVAVDQDGRMLVWTGGARALPSPAPALPAIEREPLAYTPRHLVEKILTSRHALEGERKQVTVVFADVAGFTDLARRLDPEVVHEVMDNCFAVLSAEVHRFEGTINQYTGDGVMALFGAPIAHEDSPRRAVHAALGIQRAMRDFGRTFQERHGLPFQMRIGINTGLVVVGKIGDDLRMDYTAVGDTTNLASRLQQLAQPGTVVISDATSRLVQGFFDTRDLGLHQVKGHPEPVHVVEVVQSRGRRTRLEVAAESGLMPHTGRARDLATLLERFQQTKAGQGQVVFLVGEAGVGKSRHVLEFRQALHAAGETMTWLEGRCLSFGQTMPFLPIADQLRTNFGSEESDGEPEIIAKVEIGMRRMGQLEPHIPAIRYLLTVDPSDNVLAKMEPVTRRKHLVDAIVALALRSAQLCPLILIYEDLHWIDSSTEACLSALLDAVAGAPILLILTYRPGYTPPFGSRSFATTLALQSLSASDTLSMARRILRTDTLPGALETLLLDKTEGVPLFVEEVIKTLQDVGVLRQENGVYHMAQANIEVPDTIQGMIMARLDHLGEGGKRAVQLASVIGRQFLVRLLERISDLSDQPQALPDAEAGVRFATDLGRPNLVAQTHAILGQVLQWQGDLARARPYLSEALAQAQHEHMGFWSGLAMFGLGHACTSGGRYEEALQWYQRLRDYAFASGDNFFMIRVPNLIGGLYLEVFDLDEALQRNLESDELAQRLSPWPEPRGHSLVKAGLAHLYRGEYSQAEACYQRALPLLEQDTWLRWRWHMPLLWARGALALAQGQYDDAWTYATQSLELAARTGSRKHLIRAQRLQGDILAATARFDEAAQTLAVSIRQAEAIGTPREVWLGKAALGKVLMRLHQDQEAEVQLTQAAQTIEALATDLRTPRLFDSLLNAAPVVDLYHTLGRRSPPTMA